MLHCMGYYKSYKSEGDGWDGEDDQKGFIQEGYWLEMMVRPFLATNFTTTTTLINTHQNPAPTHIPLPPSPHSPPSITLLLKCVSLVPQQFNSKPTNININNTNNTNTFPQPFSQHTPYSHHFIQRLTTTSIPKPYQSRPPPSRETLSKAVASKKWPSNNHQTPILVQIPTTNGSRWWSRAGLCSP